MPALKVSNIGLHFLKLHVEPQTVNSEAEEMK